MSWTRENIGSIDGKVAVVTGANSGIGFEAAKTLADKGAEVVMACRVKTKADEARSRIEKDVQDPDIRIIELDLADLNSVNNFSRRFNEKYDRLDILVNNAGVMHIPFKRTDFGFEYQFGVNHLGHFVLTSNLMEVLEETENSRVVCVSSALHKKAELDFHSMNEEESYDKGTAYADSKMANLMFAKSLNKRFEKNDIDSIAVAVHPGYAATNLQIKSAKSTGGKLKVAGFKALNKVVAQSAEDGAMPTLYGATEDLDGGEFIGPSGFMEMRGSPKIVEPDERANNEELREELWEFSEEELGMKFEL